MSDQWYCARTAGRDTRAAFYLRRGGFNAFRPVIHRYRIEQRTKREVFRELSLFPGYVFIEADSPAHACQAKSAIGVAGILGEWIGDTFTPRGMPAGFVDELVGSGPVIEGRRQKFNSGDRVKVAIGALAEIIATVESHDDRKVTFRAMMFGAEISISVDEGKVAAIAAE